MHDIDFLPLEYRQERAQRRWKPWRVLVILAFLALLGMAAGLDYHRRGRVQTDLAAISDEHQKATDLLSRLTRLQQELAKSRAESDLYTYLRHPWPRTQILAAILAPLPAELQLEKLQLATEIPRGLANRSESKSDEQTAARLPPESRDLKRLRAEHDPAEVRLIIQGLAADASALHRYLGDLSQVDLVAKAELDSIETLKTPDGLQQRFSATVVVRPGYGQPNGPTSTKIEVSQSPPSQALRGT